MKAFARRSPAHTNTERADTGSGGPCPEETEAEEFIERLGDLDRFIGAPAVPPGPTAIPPSGPPVLRPTTPLARNLPALPTGALAPISHPVPPAPTIPRAASPAPDADDEAQDFLDRLSDLDRFIGAPASPRQT